MKVNVHPVETQDSRTKNIQERRDRRPANRPRRHTWMRASGLCFIDLAKFLPKPSNVTPVS